jgi:hypothetical protein
MGGDGTFSEVARGLHASGRAEDIPLAMLPTGTANDQGRSFGLSADPTPSPATSPCSSRATRRASTRARLRALDAARRGGARGALLRLRGVGLLPARARAAQRGPQGDRAACPWCARSGAISSCTRARCCAPSSRATSKTTASTPRWCSTGKDHGWTRLTDLIVKGTRVYGGMWVLDPTSAHDDGAFEVVPFTGRRDWLSKADGSPRRDGATSRRRCAPSACRTATRLRGRGMSFALHTPRRARCRCSRRSTARSFPPRRGPTSTCCRGRCGSSCRGSVARCAARDRAARDRAIFSRHDGRMLAGATAFFALVSVAPMLLIALVVAGALVDEHGRARELLAGLGSGSAPTGARAVRSMLANAQRATSGRGDGAVRGGHRVGRDAALQPPAAGAGSPVGRAGGSTRPCAQAPLGQVKRRARVLRAGAPLRRGGPRRPWPCARPSSRSSASSPWAASTRGTCSTTRSPSGAVSSLFALVFRVLPHVRITVARRRCVGSAVTTTLFALGRVAVSGVPRAQEPRLHLRRRGLRGALLLWVYYSSQIFFLGAAFIAARAGACWAAPSSPPTTPSRARRRLSRDPGFWLRGLEFSWDQPSQRAPTPGPAPTSGGRE